MIFSVSVSVVHLCLFRSASVWLPWNSVKFFFSWPRNRYWKWGTSLCDLLERSWNKKNWIENSISSLCYCMSSFFSLFCFRGLISWQRTRSITTVNTRIMRNEVSLSSCFLNSNILFHSFILSFLNFYVFFFYCSRLLRRRRRKPHWWKRQMDFWVLNIIFCSFSWRLLLSRRRKERK